MGRAVKEGEALIIDKYPSAFVGVKDAKV